MPRSTARPIHLIQTSPKERGTRTMRVSVSAPIFVFLVLAIVVPKSSGWSLRSSTSPGSNLLMLLDGRPKYDESIIRRCKVNALHAHVIKSVGDAIDTSNNVPVPIIKPQRQSQHYLHLVSLPYPSNKTETATGDGASADAGAGAGAEEATAESLLKKCWSWKDMALGDGANHFVPRRQRRRRRGRIEFIPRSVAIQQLQSLFVGMEIKVVGGDGSGSFQEVILRPPDNDENKKSPKEVVIPMNTSSSEFDGHFEETVIVEECSVLSTCARLNIILVLRSFSPEKSNDDASSNTTNKNDAREIARNAAICAAVSYTLLQQTNQSKQHQDKQQSTSTSTREQRKKDTLQLANQLTHLKGSHAISSHLCLVASGLTPRPDHNPERPNSGVIFRPYSSRDSHILMQLKRAVEIISVQGRNAMTHIDGNGASSSSTNNNNNGRQRQRRKNSKTNRRPTTSQGSRNNRNQLPRKKAGMSMGSNSSRGRIKTLLDGALRAGKMARNENIVPEIIKLKEYCSDESIPPDELSIPAVEAVMKHAITPSVASCVEKVEAMEKDTSKQISTMRQRVSSIVDELMMEQNSKDCTSTLSSCNYGDLKRRANQLLHEPTMQLRLGRLSDVKIEDSIVRIEKELVDHAALSLSKQKKS